MEDVGFTQFPNVFFYLIPRLKEAELKIFLIISRETLGWHKPMARISYSQFQKKTGLTRQGLRNGLVSLKAKNLIIEKDFEYGINLDEVVNIVDQSKLLTSQRSRPVLIQNSQDNRPEVVNIIDQQQSIGQGGARAGKNLNKGLNKSLKKDIDLDKLKAMQKIDFLMHYLTLDKEIQSYILQNVSVEYQKLIISYTKRGEIQ